MDDATVAEARAEAKQDLDEIAAHKAQQAIVPTAREVVKRIQQEKDMLRASLIGHERALAIWQRKARLELLADETKLVGKLHARLNVLKRWYRKVTTVRLWIVGLAREGRDWEFIGVFSTRAQAAARCQDRGWFIAPVGLDRPYEVGTEGWPGMEVPNTAEVPQSAN